MVGRSRFDHNVRISASNALVARSTDHFSYRSFSTQQAVPHNPSQARADTGSKSLSGRVWSDSGELAQLMLD